MWIDREYIRLRCLHKDQAIYDGLHLVARRRSRPATTGAIQKAQKKHNVVVISVGATSRSDLERNFRYTASFLRHSLEAHELHGYSAVGAGSFASAAAFLGGMTAGEAWARSSGSFYDVLPLLWKEYSKEGHWTLYIEETPSEGAFVDPVDRGFLRKPTDHYPLAIASQMSVPDKAARSLEHDVGMSNDQPSICSGYRLRSKALLNYASDLIRASDGQPFFAFINLKDSSRHGANARVLDKPLKTFLANLKRQNVSVETTVVLLSDIGKSHWDTGIAGDGSGLPFCFVKLAPLLVERYLSVSSSLSVNQHRLTAPYDVHATLKALAALPGELSLQPTRHGQSLLAQIPTNRTCLDASVPKEFCACVEGSHVSSPQVRPETLQVARRALEFVNNATSSLLQLKQYCATFALWRVEYVDENPSPVTSAASTNASPIEKVLMILSTVPRAIFSVRARRIAASIEYGVEGDNKTANDESFHKLEIMDVDRIDRYADDVSKCIKFVNAKVRRYCYCKDIAL
ncbi:hypothetical protein HPB50_008321 [Hyalomma asiaticum]|uniref:Uncharacterized protein n=1 Tax=Hyalomma asiaticum TaxID=266040 RepID=A0ACB7T041_HYAAI|nr:hypothetical protein HPB50_008321 [Hyalomma asiaticum]